MPEKKDEPHQFSRIAEELVGDLRGLAERQEPHYNLAGRSARPKQRKTLSLSGLVEELLQKHQIGRSAPEYTIREHWKEIVGAANASYSHAQAIERNRLTVLTSHAVVRNELFMHRDEIVARIRKLPGCGEIKSLYLRNG